MTPTKALHDKKLELKKGKLAVCSNVTCAFKPLSNGNVSFVVWWHNWARTFYIDNLSPSQALAILAAQSTARSRRHRNSRRCNAEIQVATRITSTST